MVIVTIAIRQCRLSRGKHLLRQFNLIYTLSFFDFFRIWFSGYAELQVRGSDFIFVSIGRCSLKVSNFSA